MRLTPHPAATPPPSPQGEGLNKSRFVDLIISHFYRELNNQFGIIQQARTGYSGAGFFVCAQIDITEIKMLISEGVKYRPQLVNGIMNIKLFLPYKPESVRIDPILYRVNFLLIFKIDCNITV